METNIINATPGLSNFDPYLIPFQKKVIKDLRLNFDYKNGYREILLSGSVGSAKSILMAHIVVTHCLFNPYARVMIGRKVRKDLEDTLVQTISDHISEDLIEGKDYVFNKSKLKWVFRNKSEIISRSWDNKNFKQFRSLLLSGIAIEELTENDDEHKGFYFEAIQRVGRLPNVKENFVMSATNPDSPSSWVYKHFIHTQHKNRHVYYSKTSDNPFLPETYINQLKENLDPKQAQRMLEGQWIEIDEEVVYYNYKNLRNFKDQNYEINPLFPVDISHDFNIGEGKPMSALASQNINGVFHCFKTFIVQGARTNDIMEEIANYGLFDKNYKFRIFGDASGKSRDTRSIKSDYDIIKQFLDNYGNKIEYEMMVPLANPPVRERHNLVNAMCYNANKEVKLFVYKEAETLDEGLRLTKLKKGGNYIEDDSFYAQHVTTALGYMIHYLQKKIHKPRETYRR